MKRLLDILASGFGLLVLSPLFALLSIAIWWQDYHSPFYVAERTGRGGRSYRMVKFRSMVVRADRSGVDSTAANDSRITRLGSFIRRFKLDELPQLWNVLKGDMSFVGPRPNVERETRIYTAEEQRLLSVRPGITDMASIVFADEGEILRGAADPDIRYNQIIRPWKSRLGLLYVDRCGSVALDIRLIVLTIRSALDREGALAGVTRLAESLGADAELARVARRAEPLREAPPPGSTEVVVSRLGVT